MTLDSIEGQPDTTGMTNNRRDSLTVGDNAATVPASTRNVNGDNSRRSRSLSPTKRRAVEMDDETVTEEVEQMDVDGNAAPLQDRHSTKNDGTSQSRDSSSNKPTSDRETRHKSVDMLGGAQGDSDSVGKSSSSANEQSNPTNGTADAEPSSESATLLAKDLPSIDEQVATIMQQASTELRDGDIGYAISVAWLNRVLARCSDREAHGPYDKNALEGDIGPIDNSSILLSGPALDSSLVDDYGDRFVPLKPGLSMSTHLEVLPVAAYNQIKKWYGTVEGQDHIQRYAHATATDPEAFEKYVQWELYPPVFTIRKLRGNSTGLDKHRAQDAKAKAPRIVASRSNNFQTFLLRAKQQASIPKEIKVKVWRILEVEAASNAISSKAKTTSMLSPPASHEGSSRESSPAPQPLSERSLLMEIDVFNNMAELTDREAIDMKDETNNPKYNGSTQLGTLGLAADQVLILEEQVTSLGTEEFISDRKKNKNGGSSFLSSGLLGVSGSGRSSPVPAGAMTRGRHRQQGRSKGTVGLTNLGNTCYMNSALQCVRANAELTTYFLAGQWTNDLNPKNPLGYGGAIAKQYQLLLESIYKQSNSAVPPRTFKSTLGKFGPQFGGYGQQDSQEFMSFLLDALHEDLNRIDKKPYIENPDSDDNRVADSEYVKELGEIYQDNYRKRNDSVVTDLFNGFYKNTMVCPICDKVSITFDPYSLLTLQLPIEHSFQHQFTYFPLHGPPVLVNIDMDKHSSLRQLKDYIASKMSVDARRVMMAEAFNNKFFRTLEDKQIITEANIQPRDDMLLYELEDIPSNFPAPKKKVKVRSMLNLYPESEEEDIPDSESPLSDRMLVPVFFRAQSSQYSNSKSLVITPTFITLRRDEVTNYTEIYRKVLSQVANQTTRPFLTEGDNQSGTSTPEMDQDAIITTEEDAADPSLATRSVESEDGMVDVLMGDSEQAENAHSEQESTASPTSNVSVSAVLQPGTIIPDNLWTIMELKIMPAGSEMITTGWNSVDANKNYPTLSSRIPKPAESSGEPSPAASTESSDADEGAEVIVPSVQSSFSPEGQSDPEEDDTESFVMFNAKPSAAHNPRANGKYNGKNKRKNKAQRTYSKKGQSQNRPQKQTDRRTSASSEAIKASPADGNPALLRLGEAIVVDFDYGAYDALFNGDSHDERGQDTKKLAPLLSDPELEAKKAKRATSKKNGILLDDCFTATSRGEVLTAENQWYCSRCKELRQAEKTLEIWTAPDVLVIHLKRFSANRVFRDKIDVVVDFPIEGLDLSDKVGVSNGKTLKYDLFAVDNHYGGLGGGHYTAFAKNFLDGNWYEYNDSSVSQCSPSKTITSAAYLLFYRRQSDDAPLGPPTVNNWFRKYWDGGNDSDTSSRAESPANNSGKGQRLGEVTSKGSSSALVVAGAGRHLRGGAGGSEATSSSNLNNGKNLDESYDADEDEGVEMDFQEPLIGPTLPGYSEQPPEMSNYLDATWGFGFLNSSSNNPRADDDNDSLVAFDGEEDAGGAEYRNMEAYGDDYSTFHTGSAGGGGGGIGSTHHTSPIINSMEYDEEVPELEEINMLAEHSMDTDEIITLGGDVEEEAEAPVAEIKVDDEVEPAKKE